MFLNEDNNQTGKAKGRENIINMSAIGERLATSVFGQSDAEKAFRPWWDNLEDFLIYGIILLGMSSILQNQQGKELNKIKVSIFIPLLS